MAMNKDELNAARFQKSGTEANRIRELSDTWSDIYNEQNLTNKLHYRQNKDHRDLDESFAHYISDFTDYVKMPLENIHVSNHNISNLGMK